VVAVTVSDTAAHDTLRADYEALRHDVGARLVGRDVVTVWGPEAVGYLQGQVSQDVADLAVGAAADSLLLTPDGKIVALVRVGRTGEDRLVVDCEAGHGQVVLARLARFKLRSKLQLALYAWSCVSLRGPHAAAAAGTLEPGPGISLVAPVSWNGWDGVDLLGEDPRVPDSVRRCGEDAWDACRIESGIPAMGAELDERTIAAEAGLVERTVSFTKGCYTGQELVARLDARGSRVARRLCGLVIVSGEPSPAGAPAAASLLGAGLVEPGGAKPVGTVTSAAWCPGVGGPAALAYVHRSVGIGATVVLVPAPGTGLAAGLAAEVRALPLI
jgi:folate-binding protein YgfZ